VRPNILFLMTDQMQGRVLEPDNPCITPNFDRLAADGVRFRRAYTPNAVCSPARASLMTGLLPHSHGVLEVTQPDADSWHAVSFAEAIPDARVVMLPGSRHRSELDAPEAFNEAVLRFLGPPQGE